jgi:hypothetical protein
VLARGLTCRSTGTHYPDCEPTILCSFLLIILPLPERGGCILFYLCPSFRPSKIFFVAFFSVTVDGRNLIFGHKRHIGIRYHIVGSVFGPVRFLLPVCRLSWFLYTLNIYAHFSSHFSRQLLMAEITSFI